MYQCTRNVNFDDAYTLLQYNLFNLFDLPSYKFYKAAKKILKYPTNTQV